MSRSNLEALRALYKEWAAGSFMGLAELVAPDVFFFSEVPEGQVECRGPQELGRFFVEFLRQWDAYRIEANDFVELGNDAVLVGGRQYGSVSSSGAATEAAIFILWTFRGEEVVSMHCSFDRSRALRAAGLGD